MPTYVLQDEEGEFVADLVGLAAQLIEDKVYARKFEFRDKHCAAAFCEAIHIVTSLTLIPVKL